MDYAAQLRSIDESDRRAADVLEELFVDVQRRLDRAEGVVSNVALLQEQLVAQGEQIVAEAAGPLVAKLRAAADLGVIFTASSVSEVAVGLGPRTFVVTEADRAAFAPAAMLTATAADAPAVALFGRKLSYDRETGQLVIDALSAEGAGAYAGWTLTAGSRVAGASQTAAAPPAGFSGETVQALFVEFGEALGGDPDFAGAVAAALSDRYTRDAVDDLVETRAARTDALDALAALEPAAERIPAFASLTGATTLPYGAAGRDLLAANTAGTARALLGAVTPEQLGVIAIPGSATDQSALIDAEVAKWAARVNTGPAGQSPADAYALDWLPGLHFYAGGRVIETPGNDAAVIGRGGASRFRGIAYKVSKSRALLNSLWVTDPPEGEADQDAFHFTGPNRRISISSNLLASQHRFGYLFDSTGAFDSLSNIVGFNNDVNLGVINGDNAHITGGESTAAKVVGTLWYNAQSIKLCNWTNNNGFWAYGSGSATLVECYCVACTFTSTPARVHAIGAPVNDGGYAKVSLSPEIVATIESLPFAIFMNGCQYWPAEGKITFSGAAGAVTSVLAGNVELLAAPVAWAGTWQATVEAVAAAITANAATQYTAVTAKKSPILYVKAPIFDGANANGRTLAATLSGGLATYTTFCKMRFDTPHGFDPLKPFVDVWFDTAPYFGMHEVKAVLSATEIAVEMPYYGAAVAGRAWRPLRMLKTEGGASIANTGGLFDRPVRLRAVSRGTVTLDVPFADLPALPPTATFELPGFDQIWRALDTSNNRCRDGNLKGGNTNYFHMASGMAIWIDGTRLKRLLWVDYRANPAMRSEGVRLHDQGYGRANDDDSVTEVGGSTTGWERVSYAIGAGAGLGFSFRTTPWKDQPGFTGDEVLTVTERQYENAWEKYIGNDLVERIDLTLAQIHGLKVSRVAGAVNTLSITPTANAAGSVVLKQEGDVAGGLDLRLGAAGLKVTDPAQNITLRVRHPATAPTSYIDLLSGATSAGPQLAAAGTGTDVPLRIAAKGAAVIACQSPIKYAYTTLGTKPAASVVGDGCVMWATDATPARKMIETYGGAWHDSTGATV